MEFLRAISWPLLLWSGLTAYVLSTWLLMVFRKLNTTRYLPRAYWSCLITGGVSDAALLFGGLVRMLVLVAAVPVVYATVFSYSSRADVLMGLMAGLVNGLLAGIALPLAARRCAGANPPGLLGWRLGRGTPLVLLVIHALYGAALGFIYVLPPS